MHCGEVIISIQVPVFTEAVTPFVRLNEPAPLTPVIAAAHNSHAQVERPPVPALSATMQPVHILPPFACLKVPFVICYISQPAPSVLFACRELATA